MCANDIKYRIRIHSLEVQITTTTTTMTAVTNAGQQECRRSCNWHQPSNVTLHHFWLIGSFDCAPYCVHCAYPLLNVRIAGCIVACMTGSNNANVGNRGRCSPILCAPSFNLLDDAQRQWPRRGSFAIPFPCSKRSSKRTIEKLNGNSWLDRKKKMGMTRARARTLSKILFGHEMNCRKSFRSNSNSKRSASNQV